MSLFDAFFTDDSIFLESAYLTGFVFNWFITPLILHIPTYELVGCVYKRCSCSVIGSLLYGGCYKRDRISIKEIACELFGYELNQPIDRKFSLEISRTLTALGWNKSNKTERIAPYGVVKVFLKS